MSQKQRLGLIAVTVVAAVVAFVLLRPTDSDDDQDKAAQSAKQPPAKTSTQPQRVEAQPGPEVPTVRIQNGRPAGGVKKIALQTGETGRINVTANGPGEVHLHGYDVEKPVAAGKTTKLRFKADIEGIFELEDHESGQQLASVEVSPR